MLADVSSNAPKLVAAEVPNDAPPPMRTIVHRGQLLIEWDRDRARRRLGQRVDALEGR